MWVKSETKCCEAHKTANFCRILWLGPTLSCGALGRGRMNAFTTDIDAEELGMMTEENALLELEVGRAQLVTCRKQQPTEKQKRTQNE